MSNESFELGQHLFHQGFKYHQINQELGGSVNNEVYKGWDCESRITRSGFANKYWNLMGGYKTSSDIRTLF